MADLMDALRETARKRPQRVVFPEAHEPVILRAARLLNDEGTALSVLVGSRTGLAESADGYGISLDGIEIVDDSDVEVHERLVADHQRLFPDSTLKGIERRLRSSLNIGALLVAAGSVDAMVAGLSHTTEEVILSALNMVGMKEGISTPSSMMLLSIPGYEGPQGNHVVFADCAVAVTPDAHELADIAMTTADSVRLLLGWEPRVAMLSFSTRGSGGKHESIERIREAVGLVRERAPDLAVDGELQLDAAISPAVAARKVADGSPVAGRANVLIFPDLNAANISYKCVQRFACAEVYGPFLQGFARTVVDLSRGATEADVVGTAILAAVHAQGNRRSTAGEGRD
jgi:phosphate acetyltransferase